MSNTIRTIVNVTTAPEFTPEAVQLLMIKLHLNVKGLALILNVSPTTIKLWLSGEVRPRGLSRRLMQIYGLCPDVIERLAAGGGAR